MMTRLLLWFISALCLAMSQSALAQTALLKAEDAFRFTVESIDSTHAQLSWQIEKDYYLYQQQFQITANQNSVSFDLPKAQPIHDDNYGQTNVYFDHLEITTQTQPLTTYQVTWQGCARDRICYPPQTIQFKTDIDGLVRVEQTAHSIKTLQDLVDSSEVSESQSKDVRAQDQVWTDQLQQHSFFYSLILFLGLGLLLAFTPCSLPMLPILSALIVRDTRGVRAWVIALVFVLSMASVYAILGLMASIAGLNFQRWLQQPSTLIAFSSLFIIFALNLFGVFELRLPNRWVNTLDKLQGMQKGGTLFGAAIMGMLSALLVGPCMTAPLAGALLFISQTQQQWQGALLLFMLGFGMGIPLLLVCVIGKKILPQVGMWMDQVKILFGFLMLALALYFIRPLLPSQMSQGLALTLALIFSLYALWRLLWFKTRIRWLYLAVLLVLVPYVAHQQYQYLQQAHVINQTTAEWNIAWTAAEFEQLLATAPAGKAIVIDVYADWCVACQPIEKRILKSPHVVQALEPFYLIKLDLSQYDAQYQAVLNQWQILGPPTYLFLDSSQREKRHLRLTGAFDEPTLIKHLGQL